MNDPRIMNVDEVTLAQNIMFTQGEAMVFCGHEGHEEQVVPLLVLAVMDIDGNEHYFAIPKDSELAQVLASIDTHILLQNLLETPSE